MAQGSRTVLEIVGLSVRYGQIEAVRSVSLTVQKGELVALLGANGAGKSSLVEGLMGARSASGRVVFRGIDVSGRPPEVIVSKGAAFVPEGRGLLGQMSVYENLQLGGYHLRSGLEASIHRVLERFPQLAPRLSDPAWSLSGGQQKMLAVARALVGHPALLILDEPTLGLSPLAVADLFELIESLRSEGQTILLAEQNAMRALQHADRAYVLEGGRVVLEGSGRSLLEDPRVRSVYLGVARVP